MRGGDARSCRGSVSSGRALRIAVTMAGLIVAPARVLPIAACLALVATGHLASCAAAPITREPLPEPAPVASNDRCGMDLRRLFADELALRPAAEPADLHLLVREAVLGPATPPEDVDALATTLAALRPAAGEPIVEDLDEVQGTVRLNLRKWLFIGGNAAELREVLAGAIGHRPDAARFEGCLEAAPAALDAAGGDGAALAAWLEAQREEAWPPVQHSEKYEKNYQPAYRVVFRRHLPPWVTAPPPTTG